MVESAADRLVPIPASGRRWTARRRARFGDADPKGRIRLDALASYIQDIATDDTDDAGLGGDMVWIERRPWPLRATDFDGLDHMNNAATWAMVEEMLHDHPQRAPYRAEIEYRRPIERGARIELDVEVTEGEARLWATGVGPDAPADE